MTAPADEPTPAVTIGDAPLTIDQVVAVARRHAPVVISDAAWERVRAAREVVERLAEDTRPHYGVSTGFGALATTSIPPEKRTHLQRSLVRSHAAGMGEEVEEEVVRALMLLRIQTLTTGRTGIRAETLELYRAVLDAGITPVVHEHGSLGCSGDLSPLAHCALVLMGEGEVRVGGEAKGAAEALAAARLSPVTLAEKEGLALINGTDGMLGMLCLAIHDLRRLLTTADIAAGMSVEGLLGTGDVFAADLQALRPHPGQALAAENLRRVLAASPIRESHRVREISQGSRTGAGTNGMGDAVADAATGATTDAAAADAASNPAACTRVQDAYSLRCAPQVHGAARDTLAHATAVAERELAAAIDNPVVTADGRVESNGNFHGAPVGYVLDFLAIALADVASMSERRTDRFLDVARNHGLPPFLADDPGTDSGLMIAQYTAAGIVSELKRLAVPASVDSIPSSAMQEDHVSMGWAAGRKLRRAVTGLGEVLAVELVTAARGIQLRAPLRPGPASAAAIAALDAVASTAPGPDRITSHDLRGAASAVADGSVVAAVAAAAGPLH